jgi:hypothetical protein
MSRRSWCRRALILVLCIYYPILILKVILGPLIPSSAGLDSFSTHAHEVATRIDRLSLEAGRSAPLGPHHNLVSSNVRTDGRYSGGTQTWYGVENYNEGASPFGRVYGDGQGEVSSRPSFVEK